MLHITGNFTIAVAQKLLQNAAKGNPYFKPHKGEHGGVSWFKVSGNAHAGLGQGAVVTVHADISEVHVDPKVNENIVVDEIENTKRRNPGWLISDVRNRLRGKAYVGDDFSRRFDVETWNAIGEKCAKLDKAIQIKIPRGCKLSKNEGVFLIVPPMVAQHLVINYDQLQDAILTVWDFANVWLNPRGVEVRKNRDPDLSRVVTLWIGPYQTEQEALDAVTGLEPEVAYGVVQIERSFAFRTVNFKASLYTDEPSDGVFRVVSLIYQNYRLARSAYKRLLPIAAARKKVHCFAGENWPQKKKDPVLFPGGQTLGSDIENDVLAQSYWTS